MLLNMETLSVLYQRLSWFFGSVIALACQTVLTRSCACRFRSLYL